MVRDELNRLHATTMPSWRKIAQTPKYLGIPAGTLCSIAKGEEIPEKHKAQLGLPHTQPAQVCLEHGIVHCYDCQTQTVHGRRSRRSWKSLWDIPEGELRWMLEHREEVPAQERT
jgi:hypothetical protein